MISKLQALALTGHRLRACSSARPSRQQTYILATLDALRTARSQLQSAQSNKGGHRVKAIALVDQAIAETNEGTRASRGD
ncbi:MAG: hypothetical protein NTX21_11365 [Alphaproteobacteria bacterium]|nr:hypothetical protein [Alphaproteobacteria bacterium]